jgi:1,4-alpha-glucan branching enzyme
MQPRYAEGNNTLNRPPTSPGRPKAPAARSESKPEEKTRETKQKPIEFSLKAPQASSAVIAGSFNNWDTHKTPMQRDGDGWKAKVTLAPGRYEYRFVVDGQWITDPNCKETVRNDYGSTNSVLVV